ncbi:MAG: aminotransferase class IV [Bifidobacteriaceae bacterium]|nr:aminotransferase class IV [Bifidobacteriaceae bacterium]
MAVAEGNDGGFVEADDGMFFGLGAFETIAVEDDAPALLPWHAERMSEALRFLGIRTREGREWDVARCLAMLRDACANPGGGYVGGDRSTRRVVKVTVTERNVIVSHRSNPYDGMSRKRGFVCRVSSVRRNETSPFTLRKTLNYGDCIFEKRAARRDGVDEPIFLNSHGLVTEGATSSVFAVLGDPAQYLGGRGGVVVTPPVRDGLLPGVMRRYVMQGWRVEERSLTLDDLCAAQEMFVTNSLMVAMPVRSLRDERGVEMRTFPDSRVAQAVVGRYMRQVGHAGGSA